MKHLRLLACSVAAFLLVGGVSTASAASPVKLWKSYPLVQDPYSTRYQSHRLAGGLPLRFTSNGGNAPSLQMLLLLFGATSVAVVGFVIVRSSLANASGSAGHGRAASPGPDPEPESEAPKNVDLLVALQPTNVSQQADPEESLPKEEGAPMPLRLRALPLPAEHEADLERALPQTGLPAPRQLEPESVPEDQGLWRGEVQEADRAAASHIEICKVALWRGGEGYCLYASSAGEGARTLSVSPSFHLDDQEIPTTAARWALKGLLHQLKQEGWSIVGEGPRWHEARLGRRRD